MRRRDPDKAGPTPEEVARALGVSETMVETWQYPETRGCFCCGGDFHALQRQWARETAERIAYAETAKAVAEKLAEHKRKVRELLERLEGTRDV